METALFEKRKFVAPEFIFGLDSRFHVHDYAVKAGVRRPMLVTDQGVLEAGWSEEIFERLSQQGFSPVLFHDVEPNPKDFAVQKGAELFLAEGCDGIIAVGGGSPMDCAKAIGIVATSGGAIVEYEGVDEVHEPLPPLICVPTTAGSAADVSQFAIINDMSRSTKFAIISKALVPDISLVDARVTTTMDPELTAFTGIDALTHAVEALVSNANSPFTDLHALKAIELVFGNLERATAAPSDLVARSNMALASLYAGLAFSNASLGAVHAMAHVLGGMKDSPHGECNTLLLPHVVEYNFHAAAGQYLKMAPAMGLPANLPATDEGRGALLEALVAFTRRCGVTGTLTEMGVKRSELEGLAEMALHDPCIVTNPKEPSLEELVALYEKAL